MFAHLGLNVVGVSLEGVLDLLDLCVKRVLGL